MRVPFFMRRTGIAAEYPEGVFILGEEESASEAAARVDHVASNRDGAEVSGVVDAGHSIMTRHYTIEQTSSAWASLLRDTVSATRTCRSYPLALRFSVPATQPTLSVAVDGHHRILTAMTNAEIEAQPTSSSAENAAQSILQDVAKACYADLSLAGALRQCKRPWSAGVRVHVEYTVEQIGDGPVDEPVGEVELLEPDLSGRSSAKDSILVVAAQAPLVRSGLRDVVSLLRSSPATDAYVAEMILRVRLRSGASVSITDVQLASAAKAPGT
jgi:hypothetical protein